MEWPFRKPIEISCVRKGHLNSTMLGFFDCCLCFVLGCGFFLVIVVVLFIVLVGKGHFKNYRHN